MNKKITFLQGEIIFPLIAGQRAMINSNAETLHTSRVTRILEISEKRIIIETLNTIYIVAPVYSEEIASYMLPSAAVV